MQTEACDVLVVGGGPAGLTAALYLGRARREVVVVDAGSPRHAVSAGVHNFLTRDGAPPALLRQIGWEQMAAYPSVRHAPGVHLEALRWDGARWIAEAGPRRWSARAALLATGVVDLHPQLPGFQEHWGRSIFHCPYCHGWESRDKKLALLAPGPVASHMLPLLKSWSAEVTWLTHGQPVEPSLAPLLEKLGVTAHTAPVEALEGASGQLERARLADGRSVALEALFVASEQRQVPLVQQLGLAQDELGYLKVDELGQTSLPMLWAAGDVTSRMQQVVMAAAQGARAGALIHHRLVQQTWGLEEA